MYMTSKIKQYFAQIVNKCPYGLPEYKTPGSSGMDLYANIDKPIKLWPLQIAKIPTGIYIQLDPFMEAQVRSRSGLSTNYGLCVVNGVGTVDSDFTGQVQAPIINLSWRRRTIIPGQRIAQLVICRTVHIQWQEVDHLDKTERGDQGFAHTGY